MEEQNKEVWENSRNRMTYYEKNGVFIVEVQDRNQTRQWGAPTLRKFDNKYSAVRFLRSGYKTRIQ